MRRRRIFVLLMVLISTALWALVNQPAMVPHIVAPEPWSNPANPATPVQQGEASLATVTLETLPVKGRAPKTGYNRAHFGDGWQLVAGCDTRNRILQRDMLDVVLSDECKVISGTISDPYTGQMIHFMRGAQTSALVQIDHVVALSNAWQTGAQNITEIQRIALANDPLELLAVDGDANQQKSDGDAATWLPANKAFRCQYVARQIAVKSRYGLWVTPAEKTAMQTVLAKCPEQILPTEK